MITRFLSTFCLIVLFGGLNAQTPINDLAKDFNVTSPQVHWPAALHSQPYQGPGIQARSGVDPILSLYLQSVLQNELVNYSYTGLTAAVTLPDGSTWEGVAGMSSATDSVETDMLFGIGSITKTFVAACIMQLQEEGKLKLSDSLFHYLPAHPQIDSTININQLLNHTSGIYNYTTHPDFSDSVINGNLGKIWTTNEILDQFVLAPYFPKGTNWTYSNTGYVLLGQIIEEVTGNFFGNEIRARFLTPMGIDRTYLWPWEPLQGPMVHLWADLGNGSMTDLTALGLSLRGFWSAAGAAGAYFSTAKNLSIWTHDLVGGDLLADSSKMLMQQTQFVGPGLSYGLGLMEIPLLDRKGIGHGGDIIFAAGSYYIPQDSISISVMTNHGEANSSNLNPIIEALLSAYLDFQAQTTNLDTHDQNLVLTYYPNPFQERVRFDVPEGKASELQVFSVLGEMVYQAQFTSQETISWEGKNTAGHPLPNGAYFFRLISEEGFASGKLLKID